MAAVLAPCVLGVATMLYRIGINGRPVHQEFARKTSEVDGQLIDVVSNVSIVRAFSGAGAGA